MGAASRSERSAEPISVSNTGMKTLPTNRLPAAR
jgi:hypothetical protein